MNSLQKSANLGSLFDSASLMTIFSHNIVL